METTAAFNDDMKEFFGAEEGAYTTITHMEAEKRTYNVKKIIRDMLIERIGKENIPVVNVTKNQSISFKICPKSKLYVKKMCDIPCKFSKKGKMEMSIYFTGSLMEEFKAEAGDIWYIYFIKDSNQPVLGLISAEKWRNLFEEVVDEMDEPDEFGMKELEYHNSVEDMEMNEVEAPDKSKVIKTGSIKNVKSLSVEEAARKEKNRKKKGNLGEKIAIEIEKRRLISIHRDDLISRITHVAKYKDGLGYDIISTDVDENGNEVEIYIEVKTTSGDVDMPFYVSNRELEISRLYNKLYYIYRIFNLRENNLDVKYYRINGAIDENFELKCTEYLAFKK